jgi:hypothetical protein
MTSNGIRVVIPKLFNILAITVTVFILLVRTKFSQDMKEIKRLKLIWMLELDKFQLMIN